MTRVHDHEMLPLSTPPQASEDQGTSGDAVSPWRLQGTANGSYAAQVQALRMAARGTRLLGLDMKQWSWMILHALLFSMLCYWDTYLSARLRGALDWQHFSWYDTLYMLGAVGTVLTAGAMYASLYASDPGWVQPGTRMEAPNRPMCQYCMVRPPLRSRHCFLSGQCVVAFDHYCDLLSTPVGDLNHTRFWIYLAVQTFVVLWGLIISVSGISDCFTPSGMRAAGGCWASARLRTTVLFFMSLFLLSLFLLFGSLWALHTYLLASSQTTYEVLKGISVPYLSTFYAMYRGPHSRQVRYSSIWPELLRRWAIGNPPPAPFSEGVARNAEIFFFAPKPYDYQYHQQSLWQ